MDFNEGSVKKKYFACRWYMICPVEIARDLSAFQAVRVGKHGWHVLFLEGRDGAGDGSTAAS